MRGKRYTEEFKLGAVKQIQEEGHARAGPLALRRPRGNDEAVRDGFWEVWKALLPPICRPRPTGRIRCGASASSRPT